MKKILFILMALLFGTTACTNKNQAPPHVDAEGIFGRTTNFYHLTAKGKATIIQMKERSPSATKFEFQAEGGLLELSTIPVSKIHLSNDSKYLIVESEPQIFEFKDIEPIALDTTTLPTLHSTIEALCINFPKEATIGTTPYLEAKIESVNGELKAWAIGADRTEFLGVATRTDNLLDITFNIGTFGTFKADLLRPLPGDQEFLKTTVSQSEWSSASQFYCHLNRSELTRTYCGTISHTLSSSGLVSSSDGQVTLSVNSTVFALMSTSAEVNQVLDQMRQGTNVRTGCVTSTVNPIQGFEGLYLNINSIRFDS